jgi:hypothetical protein
MSEFASMAESRRFYMATIDRLEREAAALRADRDALAVALRECVTETPGAACYNTGRKTRRLEAINDIAQQALSQHGGNNGK